MGRTVNKRQKINKKGGGKTIGGYRGQSREAGERHSGGKADGEQEKEVELNEKGRS